jgi:transposase
MSNVLSEAKRQQVIALGRLGWPLRRIEQETGVRRETASAYLKAAGVGVRPPGAWGRRASAKPANEVTTGSDAGQWREQPTRLFVMVLGCSRKAARFLTFRSSSRIWAELHEKAFRRLGGATRVVVLCARGEQHILD